MFRSSSERYEANCDRRFRMHYRNGYVPEQSERNKPLFPVRESIVFERERRSDKHLRRVDEIQAVGLQVRLAFTFIPLKLHLRSVYTELTHSKRERVSASRIRPLWPHGKCRLYGDHLGGVR